MNPPILQFYCDKSVNLLKIILKTMEKQSKYHKLEFTRLKLFPIIEIPTDEIILRIVTSQG